ncbi:MAG: hypothetical protein U0457_16715 [Candidatus Sericytochromatia bacterium]
MLTTVSNSYTNEKTENEIKFHSIQSKAIATNFTNSINNQSNIYKSNVTIENKSTYNKKIDPVAFVFPDSDITKKEANIKTNNDKATQNVLVFPEKNITKVKADKFTSKILEIDDNKVVSKTIAPNFNFLDAKNKENSSAESKEDNNYIIKSLGTAKERLENIVSNNTKNTENTVNQLGLEHLYIVSDAITLVENKKLFSDPKLKELNELLGKITEGKALTKAELNTLNSFATFMLNKSDSLGLDKAGFQKIINLTNGILKAQEKIAEKTKDFMQKTEQLDNRLKNLLSIVSDPKMKLSPYFTQMLQDLASKYEKIKNSGNPISIELYSVYLDNIFKAMESVGSSNEPSKGIIFEKIQKDYERMVDKLFQGLGKGEIPEQELKLYLGDKAESLISLIKSKIREVSTRGNMSGNNFKPTPNLNKFFDEMKSNLTFSNEERANITKLTVDDIKTIMKNEKVANSIKEIRNDIKNLNKSFSELSKAYQEIDKLYNDLDKELKNIQSNLSKIERNSEKIDEMINEELKKLIQIAEESFDKLSLDVSDSTSNLVELLQKFRAIIVELDLNLRAIKNKVAEKKSIDDSYLKGVKEREDRKKISDEKHAELFTKIKARINLKVMV